MKGYKAEHGEVVYEVRIRKETMPKIQGIATDLSPFINDSIFCQPLSDTGKG